MTSFCIVLPQGRGKMGGPREKERNGGKKGEGEEEEGREGEGRRERKLQALNSSKQHQPIHDYLLLGTAFQHHYQGLNFHHMDFQRHIHTVAVTNTEWEDRTMLL